MRVISAESGDAQRAVVRLAARGPAGSEWNIEYDDQAWLSTTIRLDERGIMIEQTVATPRTRIVRATREEAGQISHRRIPDRELLMFPFDRQLPPTHRLKRLDVKLTWKDIPRDEFQLEDSRQSILSLEQEGGVYTALVRLTRPAEGGPDLTLPVSREQFAGSLASTDYILPEDEEIAGIAAEIAGTTTSARAAAAAICKWVSDHIEPTMIAETIGVMRIKAMATAPAADSANRAGTLLGARLGG